MISYSLIGGHGYGTEVGAFQQISAVNQDYRQVLEAMAANDENSIIRRSVAAGTLKLRDITAYQYSPYLTGTLRAAHRAITIQKDASTVVGIIYIDPTVINPVYGGKPAIYGFEVMEYKPWPTQAMNAAGPAIIDQISQQVLGSITEILA